MALTRGTCVGPYEIVALLGAGGMGEVYRARDSRLDRTVAIKVLPDSLAADPQFRERFDREARAISQLTHPHICTLYDVGEQSGTAFLVMEYLDGETLAERLTKGKLPLPEALTTSIAIASALDTAHRAGIVHRDLKPGNVMLTKSGAKLLDFGLAKTNADVVAGAGLSMLPTTPPNLTAQGAILGTFQYMAPEQLEGKEADARTDIFAFGAVVYEMLTGRKAFAGKSHASLISAILSADPAPMAASQPLTPPALDRVIKVCLAKDPDARWQSAADLSRILSSIQEWVPERSPIQSPAWRRPFFWLMGIVTITASAAVGAALYGLLVNPTPQQPEPRPLRRFSIRLPDRAALAPVGAAPLGIGRPALALSHDGSRLAFIAEQDGRTQLYLRALDDLEARPLSGTDAAYDPFFSPDGQWIGFFVGNQLKKIAVSGGQPVTLCEVWNSYGATWADDGMIYFAPREGLNLSRVSAAGGRAEVVAMPDRTKGIGTFRWPNALPGGNVILFSGAGVGAISVKTREQQALIPEGSSPTYVSTGHLVYARPGGLMAVRFDVTRLKVTGPPTPVLEGVRTEALGAPQYAVSADGTIVYLPGSSAAVGRLVWVDRRGAVEALPFAPVMYGSFSLSPEGARVVLGDQATGQLWIDDLNNGSRRRFTTTEEAGASPIWTPDGKRIAFAFAQGQNAPASVVWKATEGGVTERLQQSERPHVPTSWSPDGRLLALFGSSDSLDVSVLDVSKKQAHAIAASPSSEWGAAFSPDGHWIAYTSDESGDYQVYVQPYPPTGEKWQVSSTEGGNEEPMWSRNGQELFYRNGRRWVAVPITPSVSKWSAGARPLFQGDYLNVPGRSYDVAPDGRFLLVQPTEQPAPTHLQVVENWFEELKRLVPTN